ncbi:hypothetical protein VT84_34290 [Gemmata sp. SH-PL17]|uniref:Uncharacterized protein n=1 Tax=Gemmata massiliana TaxID=1210884 RepID=A0A6P2CUG7_9BACT|nr:MULTISPECIES: hypothetical protein [Gemmata]AMV29515.1 hypothetical protein VT84_34290 [Gemmata sp. SH-PL17]VTR91344.1 unnamed protein product [Gemmata massiliana]
MFEVIICTVSSGRVQRKAFTNWEAARAYADRWSEKGRGYRVALERIVKPMPLRVLRPGRSMSI